MRKLCENEQFPQRFELIVLTLSWRRPLSYRNQSIDLLRKSVDWFLYDNGLRHEKLKLCGHCASLQNFHTRKLGEILVFYAISVILWLVVFRNITSLLSMYQSDSRKKYFQQIFVTFRWSTTFKNKLINFSWNIVNMHIKNAS